MLDLDRVSYARTCPVLCPVSCVVSCVLCLSQGEFAYAEHLAGISSEDVVQSQYMITREGRREMIEMRDMRDMRAA